jgi:hypothetical protein
MRRLLLAFRVFFRTLFHGETARQVELILAGKSEAAAVPATEVAATKPKPKPAAAPSATSRNEGVNLLAMLQREARLVDFLQEDLSAYNDGQIGAAVRQIHRDAAQVLGRAFALKPVWEAEEGAEVEVPAGFDAGRYRLTGNLPEQPPYRGRLVHHGWEATSCQLPAWSGTAAAARVVAPAEIEIK